MVFEIFLETGLNHILKIESSTTSSGVLNRGLDYPLFCTAGLLCWSSPLHKNLNDLEKSLLVSIVGMNVDDTHVTATSNNAEGPS